VRDISNVYGVIGTIDLEVGGLLAWAVMLVDVDILETVVAYEPIA